MSEARVRANNKYNKEHVVQFSVKLNKTTDSDLIEYLDKQASKQGCIKEALRYKMLYESMGQ